MTDTDTTPGGFNYGPKIQAMLGTAVSLEADADRLEAAGDAERAAERRAAAATYRTRAEDLMIKYRVAEEEALAVDATAITPTAHDIVLLSHPSAMQHWYTSVFRAIAHHTGVRVHFRYDSPGVTAQVVGYAGDVRYAEFLWTSALLMFSTRIDPRWDDTLPEAENIFRLRRAGLKRRVIADRAWGNGHDAAARTKVQRIYAAEAKRQGEEASASGLGFNAADYRDAYAGSFRDTLAYRLQAARDAADSVAGGVVLHGRRERVDEAFYALFPYYRPTPTDDTPAAPAEPCKACAKAKSGHCRQHPASYLTKAERERWERRLYGASAQAGRAGGARAAEGVIISRGHTPAQRLDPSGHAIEG